MKRIGEVGSFRESWLWGFKQVFGFVGVVGTILGNI